MKLKNNSYVIPFLMIPFSQLYLFFTLLSKMTWEIQRKAFLDDPLVAPALITVVFCLFGDIILVIAVNRIEKEKELEKQLKLNEERKKSYEILDRQQKQIRQMQHDIDNHVIAVKNMLESGDSEAAREYLDEISIRNMVLE